MGLDMYLYRRTHLRTAEYYPAEMRETVSILNSDDTPNLTVQPSRITSVIEEVLYWRKANMIHKWFVDNIQDGEDDCAEYPVSSEYLIDLRNVCEAISKLYNKGEVDEAKLLGKKTLSIGGGFFFGSSDIDEWYFRECEDTQKAIDDLLKEEKINASVSYFYRSSW